LVFGRRRIWHGGGGGCGGTKTGVVVAAVADL
jgi:hypothetical protein